MKEPTPEEMIVALKNRIRELETGEVQAEGDLRTLRIEIDILEHINERLVDRIQRFEPSAANSSYQFRRNEIIEFWVIVFISMIILGVLIIAAADLGPFGAK